MQREQLESANSLAVSSTGVPPCADSMPRAVDPQVADLDDVCGGAVRAPEESSDPRQELLERKRLSQVVVGSSVQRYLSASRSLAGDEDGRVTLRCAHSGKQIEPRAIRQLEVDRTSRSPFDDALTRHRGRSRSVHAKPSFAEPRARRSASRCSSSTRRRRTTTV